MLLAHVCACMYGVCMCMPGRHTGIVRAYCSRIILHIACMQFFRFFRYYLCYSFFYLWLPPLILSFLFSFFYYFILWLLLLLFLAKRILFFSIIIIVVVCLSLDVIAHMKQTDQSMQWSLFFSFDIYLFFFVSFLRRRRFCRLRRCLILWWLSHLVHINKLNILPDGLLLCNDALACFCFTLTTNVCVSMSLAAGPMLWCVMRSWQITSFSMWMA